jgi:Flp pilus assembly protein TadG
MTRPIQAAEILWSLRGLGLRGCVRTGKETAGPSTALRSGRDDNSVARKWSQKLIGRMDVNGPIELSSRPERSAVEGPAVSLPVARQTLRSLFRCRESGQATLEMVVSLTVIFSLVFWLFELCMFTYTCSVLNDAAQEGVRYAIMHGTDSSVCSGPDAVCTNQTPYSNVQAVVNAAASASLHNTSAMTVTVTYANSTAATGNPVAVKVAYTYVPYLNFPGLANALTFTSQGQILY